MLIIAGLISTDSGNVAELAKDMRAELTSVRAEDGCLASFIAVDDAAAGSILVFECWRDAAAHGAHLAQPAVRAIFEKWGDRMTVEMKKYDAANERNVLD